MSITSMLRSKLQNQIDNLRNKQANCSVSEREAIQRQIQALQRQLDALGN